jgi:hypothetical protein
LFQIGVGMSWQSFLQFVKTNYLNCV